MVVKIVRLLVVKIVRLLTQHGFDIDAGRLRVLEPSGISTTTVATSSSKMAMPPSEAPVVDRSSKRLR